MCVTSTTPCRWPASQFAYSFLSYLLILLLYPCFVEDHHEIKISFSEYFSACKMLLSAPSRFVMDFRF